jgi:GNAT superfamily N-acetyltransferase/RimJ/RimL family protein N-acetyltransferase
MTTIRRYEPGDAQPTQSVFERAIRITASADYPPAQIDAWSSGTDPSTWAARRAMAETWVAEEDQSIVGFTDLGGGGHIDMLFVDPEAGRRGVASALLAHLIALALARGVTTLTVDASKTARPFFERHGFSVDAVQQVERAGVTLTNFRMSRPVVVSTGAGWLPEGFTHPLHVEWRDGVHLRPIRAADVDIDMPAVMGNREMLWELFGEAWGWPPATMTAEQDIDDLQRHADEMERHESFNYAILPADESELFGCIYIDPIDADRGIEAEVSWWVTPRAPEWLAAGLGPLVMSWIRDDWPFTRVHTPFNGSRFPPQ